MASRSYVVRAGDTLGKLAVRYTGDPGRWGELAVENPGIDPRRILIGQTLRLPASWTPEDTGATDPHDAVTRPEIHTWRTLADGSLEVDGRVPTLSGPAAALFDAHVAQWATTAMRSGLSHRVPPHWILGTIYRESGGNPDARSADGGFGLMQLTSAAARGGYSDDAIMAPELNVELGARLIAVIRKPSDSIVEVASKYNAGAGSNGAPHPSEASPWGYRETAGHISAVVAGSNYALNQIARTARVAGSSGATMLFLLAALGLAWLHGKGLAG